jgi:hypothetical protein
VSIGGSFLGQTEREWIGKKANGLAVIFVGVIVFVMSIFLAIVSIPAGGVVGIVVSIPLFLISLGLIWYGGQLWDKAKHIAWTHEALREYDAPRRWTDRAIMQRYPSNEPVRDYGTSQVAGTRVYCRHCGSAISSVMPFCPNCGSSQR